MLVPFFAAIVVGQMSFSWPSSPKPAAPASHSLNNVKQISLATLMYTQDHEDALPRATNFKAAVSRYLKDPDVFTAPGAPKGSVGYSFEPRLFGKRITTIMNPAATAMIIEGANGKQAFPYEGRTVVGYVDGHAKLVNAKMALKARATPLK